MNTTYAAPATCPAEMFWKVNGVAAVKAYVETYNNAAYVSRHPERGFIVRATDFAIKYIAQRAGFQAEAITVHDASTGDATWRLYRPAGVTQFI